MIMFLYTINDKVAQDTGPVFEAKNDGVAARNFRAMIEKQAIDASEYKLLCLGSVSHEDPIKIESYEVPREVPVDMTRSFVKEDVGEAL